MANDHQDKAEELALFRYRVISEAASPRLSPAERGRLARELAARSWVSPDGTERCFSRTSIDRWLAAYAKHGLAGLAPVPRSDRGRPRSPAQWLDEAARLRRAVPARSATQIVDIIARANGPALRAHGAGSPAPPRPVPPGPVGRPGPCFWAFRGGPAQRDSDRRRPAWALRPHPCCPGSRRAKLFVLVDDYSRLLVHGRWVTEENTRAGEDVLRSAISRRGRPEILYVDYADLRVMPTLLRTGSSVGVSNRKLSA